MKKARFSSQQQAVKIIEDTDKYYIFICLNEEKKTEKLKDTDKELEYFEYDYTEIVELKENIDRCFCGGYDSGLCSWRLSVCEQV